MRIIVEVRDLGTVHRVERDKGRDNWFDDKRNKQERRQCVIDATNDLLRALSLDEIVGELTVSKGE